MTTAIEVDSLGKVFRPRRQAPVVALAAVSLRVPVGQMLGLLGAPGAGKTTLLRLLGGLLRPTTGQVRLFGREVPRERLLAARLVGMVAGGCWYPGERRSIRDLLLARGRGAGVAEETLSARIAALLEELDLAACAEMPVRQIWPATGARLALAAALLADPPILLLDEPTPTLDSLEAQGLLAWLARLAHERGKTVVLATSHVDYVREHCDRVVLLHEGRLLLDRPAAELRRLLPDEVYQIVVKGQIDDEWSDWFGTLSVARTGQGLTVLAGPICDQAVLHGVLVKVRDLGLPLLSLSRVEPEVADVLDRARQVNGPVEAPTGCR